VVCIKLYNKLVFILRLIILIDGTLAGILVRFRYPKLKDNTTRKKGEPVTPLRHFYTTVILDC